MKPSVWNTQLDWGVLLEMSDADLEAHGYEKTSAWVRRKIDELTQLDLSPEWILSRNGLSDVGGINAYPALGHLGEHGLVCIDSITDLPGFGDDEGDCIEIEWKDQWGNIICITFSLSYSLKDKTVDDGFVERFSGHDTSIIESVWITHKNTYIDRKLSKEEVEALWEEMADKIKSNEIYEKSGSYFINGLFIGEGARLD